MELDERKIYYVYEWYNKDTGEIFYVGKGMGHRCQDKSLTERNRAFVDYLEKNPNCSYRKIIENIDEETACNEEDKRIKELKAQGLCTCNLTNRTSHRGVLYGEDNGMYGKHHTEEVREKLREINKDGRNAGKNNSQYGISPKQRMSEDIYNGWLKKITEKSYRGSNGRASKMVAYNDKERYEFDCVVDCAEFIRSRNPDLTCTLDSTRSRISECIRTRKQYKGFYFDNLNKQRNEVIEKIKTSVRIDSELYDITTKYCEENNKQFSKLINEELEKMFHVENLSIEKFRSGKTNIKTLRMEKGLFEKLTSLCDDLGINISNLLDYALRDRLKKEGLF